VKRTGISEAVMWAKQILVYKKPCYGYKQHQKKGKKKFFHPINLKRHCFANVD